MAMRKALQLRIPYLFWLIPVSRLAALPVVLVSAMIRLAIVAILLSSAANATSYNPADDLSSRTRSYGLNEIGDATGEVHQPKPMFQRAAISSGVKE